MMRNVLLFLSFLPCLLASPHSLSNRDAPPTLAQALAAAKKVSCNQVEYVEGEDYTPGSQWSDSGAMALLNALVLSWRENSHEGFQTLSQYIGVQLGAGSGSSPSFYCGDVTRAAQDDDCIGYQPKCVQNYGPAADLILTSMHNIEEFRNAISSALLKTTTQAQGDDGAVAELFVDYNQPDMGSEAILSMLTDIVMPFGAGQMISRTVGTAVKSLASQATRAGEFYLQKIKDFKLSSQLMGFELSDSTLQFMKEGRNPTAGALGLEQNTNAFSTLTTHMLNTWGQQVDNLFGSIFNGTAKDDVVDKNGISNYATFLGMLDEGKWSRPMPTDGLSDTALKALTSHLIMIAELQNDKVRPTIVVRPYACSDTATAKKDSKWWVLVQYPSSTVAVSLPSEPKKCFYVFDANKDGLPQTNCREGCFHQKTFVPLQGMDSGPGHLDGKSWEGIKLDNYVSTVWLGAKQGVKNFNIQGAIIPDNAEASDLFSDVLAAPGAYSSYFSLCGIPTNYDDNQPFDNSGPYIKLIEQNLMSAAADWGFADRSKGYPCRKDPTVTT